MSTRALSLAAVAPKLRRLSTALEAPLAHALFLHGPKVSSLAPSAARSSRRALFVMQRGARVRVGACEA